MRIELIIFVIAAILVANIYTEGKYLKVITGYKKYYQIAGIIVGAIFVYYLIKKNPLSAGAMLSTTSDYLKYLPIDKGTSSILNPILDFTSRQNLYGGSANSLPVQMVPQHISSYEKKLMTSGSGNSHTENQDIKKTKRSVSETKKKFVAARQGWKCGDCQNQLNAWFEVDHKIRLEYGGSNHIDNLVALCRDCHGKKTTIENL
jgi:hypothetical protein